MERETLLRAFEEKGITNEGRIEVKIFATAPCLLAPPLQLLPALQPAILSMHVVMPIKLHSILNCNHAIHKCLLQQRRNPALTSCASSRTNVTSGDTNHLVL